MDRNWRNDSAMKKVIAAIGEFFLIVSMVGCSVEPEVINRRSDIQEFGAIPSQNSDDAQRAAQELSEFVKKLNTPTVVACHQTGMLYDRRAGQCSQEYKIADFPCNRPEIEAKFSDSGPQIVAILDRALGGGRSPEDRGEGFLIDQCGVNDKGRLLVVLVRPTADGKVAVREIQ
jgi:hypothetical protein